jgi:hypothetical protein
MNMKKLIVCVLILVMALGIITSALGETTTPASSDFTFHNGVKLGMTREEVRQIEGTESASDQSGMLYNGQFVGGFNAQLVYVFQGENGTLSTIYTSFLSTYADSSVYIDEFNKIDTGLGTKYTPGLAVNWYCWDVETYKDQPKMYGVAIAEGDMRLESQWYCGNVEIFHALTGGGGVIYHTIRYQDKDFVAPLNTDGL